MRDRTRRRCPKPLRPTPYRHTQPIRLVAVVQHKQGGTNSGTSFSVTTTATGAGNLLIAGIGMDNGTTTVTSITDGTTAFTQVASARVTNSSQTTDIWYQPSSNTGKTSFTFNLAATTTAEGEIWEISGIASASPDGANTINGTSSGTSYPGAAVTPSSPQVGVGVISSNNNSVTANPTVGNEFTAGGDIGLTINGAACSVLTTSGGSHAPAWTGTGSGQNYCASTAFFKDTGGGGGGVRYSQLERRERGVDRGAA